MAPQLIVDVAKNPAISELLTTNTGGVFTQPATMTTTLNANHTSQFVMKCVGAWGWCHREAA
jgi:hypothetical protein